MRSYKLSILLFILVSAVCSILYVRSIDYFMDFKKSKQGTESVIIPINNSYYCINIKGGQNLKYSNDFNIWVYDTTTISVTSKNPFLKNEKSGIYYNSNMLAKKIEDKWVTVQDSSKYLYDSFISLENNYLIEEVKEDIRKTKVLKILPNSKKIVNSKKVINTYVVPKNWNNISKNSVIFTDSKSYFIGCVSYVKYEDACTRALKRLKVLYGNVSTLYMEGDIMFAEYGDYCVGVKSINYNTQAYMYGKGQEIRNIVLENLRE